jgi:hypothetical protein
MMPLTPLAVNRSERATPPKRAEPQKLRYEGRLVRTRRGGNGKKDVLKLALQARGQEVRTQYHSTIEAWLLSGYKGSDRLGEEEIRGLN